MKIALIVVIIVSLVLLVILVALLIWRMRKRNSRINDSKELENMRTHKFTKEI